MIDSDIARGLYANPSAPLPPDWPGGYWWHWLVFAVLILAFVLIMIMVFIYMERKIIGRFQIRYGPNQAGPRGILQPVADAIKVLLKEDIVPAKGDKWVHFLAPIVPFVAALMIFAVVPFQDGAALVDLNIGILYIVAISSLSVVGIFMAGWGSNNKFSLLSAMRTVAQMVSYEVPLLLSIAGVIIITGSLSMSQIVEAQSIPFILLQPLGFLIYFLCAASEINRAPFDLLEAESEIIAGFHTEYSGMKFALFYLGEYGHALAVATITTTLFLGGWAGPILPPFLWFLIKVVLVFGLLLWTRATLPRLRVDQLMGFAWKFLLPLALVNLFLTGAEAILWPEFPWGLIFLNFAIAGVLILGWTKLLQLGGDRVAL
jgi:NADH-quinone oxidoreductase subunit H